MGLFGKKGSTKNKSARRKNWALITLGAVMLYIVFIAMNLAVEKTSSDEFCMSCHVHSHADNAWKLSTHFDNSSGVIVHCIECHLPPKGEGHIWWKAYFGAKDVYKFYFTDTDKINWEAKGEAEVATHFTFLQNCTNCHSNLFPSTLSDEGGDAHLHYQQNLETITCLNCHITVGHYDESRKHEHNLDFGVTTTVDKEIYTEPTEVTTFENFTEMIPRSTVSFEMIAVPGGTFTMGSPESEKFRGADEGPQVQVQVSDFWIGMAEVSWDEFLAFYAETATVGHTATAAVTGEHDEEIDAISGPTAPWGAPDQGWGRGSRPAITMSFHAAEVYCQWLSQVTGKKYRLPTEAEWEYACRAGTSTPYFFEGGPKDYTKSGWKNSLLGPETEIISDYSAYSVNSGAKTVEPGDVKPNPFGLVNMPGNVWEFVSDWYAPNTYQEYAQQGTLIDPKGPESGEEHVIRGGAYDSDAVDLRSAKREQTRSEAWLVTDPQIPKSIWWYSDSKNVGFQGSV